MPAAILEVEITEIKDSISGQRLDNIWSAFQDPPLIRTIDLTDIGVENKTITEYEEDKFEGETGTAKDNQASDSAEGALEDEELVRFQYDGVMSMGVSFDDEVVQTIECFDKEIYPNADSFHIIEYMSLFTVRIDVWHDINGQHCDAVDDKYKVVVTNNVGLEDAGASGFEDFYNELDSLTKETLAVCSDIAPPGSKEAQGSCAYDILHDDDGRSAGVDTSFATGRPNIIAPYTKSIFFSVSGTEDVRHTAAVFINGLYSKGPGNSFALPTHQPIMVLRDPPGGSSYASYENIVTTAKVVTSSTHVSGNSKLGLNIKTGVDVKTETCAGGGFGAIVMACLVS